MRKEKIYCLNASKLLWLQRIERIIISIVYDVKTEIDSKFEPKGQYLSNWRPVGAGE